MSKLHLVFGGRVSDPRTLDFNDLSKIEFVGVYPDYASAEKAWRAAAQRTVDDERRDPAPEPLPVLDPQEQPRR